MPASQLLGHLEIPSAIADLILGLCVLRPGDKVLDPGCGEGYLLGHAEEWLNWLASEKADLSEEPLWGIEFDQESARLAFERVPEAQIINQNYFTKDADLLPKFDAVVGNPPYIPTVQIGRLEQSKPRQLPLFPPKDEYLPSSEKLGLVTQEMANSLGSRAGLHAYYFLHSVQFLKEGGRLGFIVPNGWLDVAHGEELKQFLLDHFRILAIVESSVERWFSEASVNTCLVILEKCGVLQRRTGNIVRLIRLRKKLNQLIEARVGHNQRFLAVEQLAAQLMSGFSRETDEYGLYTMEQGSLRAEGKWGKALRAPAVYRRHRNHLDLQPLEKWATVQRGYTTGANEFFYLDAHTIADWALEPEFIKPLLKSLRGVYKLRLRAEDCHQRLLFLTGGSRLRGTNIEKYIRWGEDQGFHLRPTCAARPIWYELVGQTAAPLVLGKGIWQRHLAPLLEDEIAVDQQLYQILPAAHVPLHAAAALLNSSWFALQVELHGRVNLGKGLLWLAAYELDEIRLPDPRRLSSIQVEQLELAFQQLVSAPANREYDLEQPERRALDEVVFDTLGFSVEERSAVHDSLKERLVSRSQLAKVVSDEKT